MSIERVDGEIAARGIFAPFTGKGDRRTPAIGADIASQGGDFNGSIVENCRYSAMLDPRRHCTNSRFPAAINYGIWQQGSRAINVIDLNTQ